MALNTTSSNSLQATASSPQTSANTTNNVSGNLQPGIANNQLNGGSGVPIHATVLSTVPVAAASTQAATPSATTSPSHHFHAGLLGIPVLLLLLAAASIWYAQRSVKTTT